MNVYNSVKLFNCSSLDFVTCWRSDWLLGWGQYMQIFKTGLFSFVLACCVCRYLQSCCIFDVVLAVAALLNAACVLSWKQFALFKTALVLYTLKIKILCILILKICRSPPLSSSLCTNWNELIIETTRKEKGTLDVVLFLSIHPFLQCPWEVRCTAT